MTWRRALRGAAWLGAALAALEVLYVLGANAILWSGLIERVASAQPEVVAVGWDRAYSPWPGRGYVSGFRMRLQDSLVQFELSVDSARADVVLWELLRKRFHASSVRARGVSYRMLMKVDAVAGQERRLAAFPVIEGFPRPALRAVPVPPPPTPADLERLWSVQLDDVDATATELWFLEYRYLGAAHVRGAFELIPLRRLWVGPAELLLEGGQLSAGEHTISSSLTARVEVTIVPVDLPTPTGIREPVVKVLDALTASIRLETALEDLGVAGLYVDGLRARGAGTLAGALRVVEGTLMPGTVLEVSLQGAELQLRGYRFEGGVQARLSVSDEAKVGASLSGTVSAPVLQEGAVVATLSDLFAELRFQRDFSDGRLRFERLSVELGEARIRDARAITRVVRGQVPLVASAVLGDGPLVGAASAWVTPGHALVRVRHLGLGAADLQGAAVSGAGGWTGAAAGHFGEIPFGLRLRGGAVESALFTPEAWLDGELLKAGITPERPRTAERR